jgi:hypothetical protein
MKLNDLYKSVLATALLHVTEDGLVSGTLAGKTEPVLVKGKRLALPTPEILRSDKSNIAVFHPLSEDIMMKGETDVLSKFRLILNNRLNFTIGVLVDRLLHIAANTADHSKLNPDQQIFLSLTKKISETTITTMAKIMDKMPMSQSAQCFVSIYMKRSGEIEKKPYRRMGVVNFPFYTELVENKDKVFGVTISKKDRETLIALFEYMFPNVGTPNAYTRGSNSNIAPYADAMMSAVMTIGAAINDIVALFDNMLDNKEELEINSDWVESFADLGSMLSEIRMVPNQDAVAPAAEVKPLGGIAPAPTQQLSNVAKFNPSALGVAPQAFQPQPMMVAPSVVNSSGKISLSAMMAQQPNHMAMYPNQTAGRASFSNPNAPVAPMIAQPQQQYNPYGQPVYGSAMPFNNNGRGF